MDGSFACPECGTDVEVQGLSPGRQVRCGFCHRLLEVPYLPRAGGLPWKRRRFARPKWVPWAWVGLSLFLVIVLGAGAAQFLRRQYDSIQDRSISHLLDSSRRQEADGRLGEALVDLDAAFDLAEKAGAKWMKRLESERARRPDLALRDAGEVLDNLSRSRSSPFPLGVWLNLIARAARDHDLAPLSKKIDQQFQTSLGDQVSRYLASARLSFASGNVRNSMNDCDRIGALIGHLATKAQAAVRNDTEGLVTELTRTSGVTVVVPQGRFIYGSSSYVSALLPVLGEALEAKNYLPRRESSPWRELWRQSLYQVDLDVQEFQEGSYLSSQNRLTLIQVMLTITSRGNRIWQTTPRARSHVPVPGLPAHLASRVAMERSEEFERLLYKNARDQLDQKFSMALVNMPVCPSLAAPKKL